MNRREFDSVIIELDRAKKKIDLIAERERIARIKKSLEAIDAIMKDLKGMRPKPKLRLVK